MSIALQGLELGDDCGRWSMGEIGHHDAGANLYTWNQVIRKLVNTVYN